MQQATCVCTAAVIELARKLAVPSGSAPLMPVGRSVGPAVEPSTRVLPPQSSDKRSSLTLTITGELANTGVTGRKLQVAILC